MPPVNSKLYKMLRVLWRYPIVILVKGSWRMGKTDTTLLCSYLGKKWGLIDKIGSNIYTFDSPHVEHIVSLQELKKWLHRDKSKKVYIFDEGLKHAYRRLAMSKKNIGVIEVLTELSKGHGRMFVISQTDKVDSDILDSAFCRAIWEKKTKKVMYCISKHHPPQTFRKIPSVMPFIKFDPDRLAPLIDKEVSKKVDFEKASDIYKVARCYGIEGKTFAYIEKEIGIHRERVKRLVRDALKQFVESQDALNEDKEGEAGFP